MKKLLFLLLIICVPTIVNADNRQTSIDICKQRLATLIGATLMPLDANIRITVLKARVYGSGMRNHYGAFGWKIFGFLGDLIKPCHQFLPPCLFLLV